MHDYLTEIAREPGVAVRPGGGCSNCASGFFLSDVAASPVSRGIFSSYPRFNSSRTLTQIFSSVHHVRCLRLEPSTLPVGDDMDYLPHRPATTWMMSCVRCSTKVLSARLFCPRSVSGTG